MGTRSTRRPHGSPTVQQGGPQPKPETLKYAQFVLVFTTLPAEELPAAEILEWYRLRWQVELVFKRLKSLAQLGHLPKHDERSKSTRNVLDSPPLRRMILGDARRFMNPSSQAIDLFCGSRPVLAFASSASAAVLIDREQRVLTSD